MELFGFGDCCGMSPGYFLVNSLRLSDAYVDNLGHHWFRQWLIAWSAPSFYLNQCWLLIGPLVTNFNEILIKIHAFSFIKIHFKMSGKWWRFCQCVKHIYNCQEQVTLAFSAKSMFFACFWFCFFKSLYFCDCCTQLYVHASALVYNTVDSRFAPSQWETSLQSNAVSHWLGPNLKSALYNIINAFYVEKHLTHWGQVRHIHISKLKSSLIQIICQIVN